MKVPNQSTEPISVETNKVYSNVPFKKDVTFDILQRRDDWNAWTGVNRSCSLLLPLFKISLIIGRGNRYNCLNQQADNLLEQIKQAIFRHNDFVMVNDNSFSQFIAISSKNIWASTRWTSRLSESPSHVATLFAGLTDIYPTSLW